MSNYFFFMGKKVSSKAVITHTKTRRSPGISNT
jgi:hypothetical protein